MQHILRRCSEGYVERKSFDVTRIQRKSGSNCVYIPTIDENTDWKKALKKTDRLQIVTIQFLLKIFTHL